MIKMFISIQANTPIGGESVSHSDKKAAKSTQAPKTPLLYYVTSFNNFASHSNASFPMTAHLNLSS